MTHRSHTVGWIALAAASAFLLAGCEDPTPEMDTAEANGGEAAEAATEEAQGDRRIDFTLPDLDGNDRQLSEWDGDLIVLNFWATWCPPCKKEMPLFQEIWEEHRDDGFTIVAVAVDELSATQHFVDDFGIEFPILIGQDEAVEVGRKYGNRIGALPYTVLIDRDGIIRDTHRGEVEEEDLQAWLDDYL
ncbi:MULTISPECIES: TlpA disulfide reductase family protein [unclassified Thioalkalivibrio]|uniref:TlpA family protein disulfide reductase n=1 Tax=unclassified Thioalkalivibrio TaxID=2621013 RepID=UPI00037F70A9|nr:MULTISPECIES: TlpA disulfide reductase family protein [unclassified Thioalkalivibrio]